MSSAAKDQLHGWKEIATYLGRDERTAKRWEKQRGLPVRRIPGSGRANVYILISELEAWLSTDAPTPPAPTEDMQLATEQANRQSQLSQQTPRSETQEPEILQAAPQPSSDSPTLASPSFGLSRRYRGAALILVIVGGAGGAAWLARRPAEKKQAVAPIPSQRRIPAGALGESIDEQYLQSLYFVEQRTPESLQEAKRTLLEVVAHDPMHAPAFAQLANTYLMLREFASVPDEDEAYFLAERAATHALALDPHLPEAHASLGYIEFFSSRNPSLAENHFLEAIRIDPTCALAHFWYGSLLTHQGRFVEALDQLNRAQQLQPTSSSIQASRAYALGLSGQRDEAVRLLRSVLKTDPHAPAAHRTLARLSLLQPRDLTQYLDETQRFAELRKDTKEQHLVIVARHSFHSGGEQAMWRSILESERAARLPAGDPSYLMAESEAQLGETEPSLQHLERLCAKHDSLMMNLIIDPLFEPLRGNSEFGKILVLVGLRAQPGPGVPVS